MSSRTKTPAPVARTSSRPERQQHSKQRSSSRWPRVSPGALWDTGDQLPLPSMWGGGRQRLQGVLWPPSQAGSQESQSNKGGGIMESGGGYTWLGKGQGWQAHQAPQLLFRTPPRRRADTLPCPGLTSQPLLSSGLGSNFRLLSRKAGQGEAPGSQSASLAERPAPASSALTSHQSGAAG